MNNKYRSLCISLLINGIIIFATMQQVFASGFQYRGMWPQLQAWYFNRPSSLVADKNGNVFIVDAGNNRIQKFSINGDFVLAWGSTGC